MELNGNDFLDELLALKTETWETINPIESNNGGQSFPSCLSFDSFGHYNNQLATLPHSSCQSFYENFNSYCTFNAISSPLLDEFSRTQMISSTQYSSYNTVDASLVNAPHPFMAQDQEYAHPLMPQEGYPLSLIEDDDPSFLGMDLGNGESPVNCKMESMQSPEMAQVFNFGVCLETKNQPAQKLQGQPSKNLMAERRRRKRLNDRLSMLRAIVPKISKMDRTSIVGDTIDYMKELLEKINKLQQESDGETDVKSSMEGMFKFRDPKPSEMVVRNTPKFDVEKRDDDDTRIDVSCAGKTGLLQTMVNTMEALGLEIEQCVISCFHDFAMQASCSKLELDNRTAATSSEDIKQALFRIAGYGGRCL